MTLALAACGGGGAVSPDAGPADAAPVAPDAAPPADPTAVVFDPSVLHRIDIEVDAAYLDALEHDRDDRVPCTFTFDGVTIADAAIRQKGGIGSVSTLADKPAFSVKFDELVAGQELHGLDKLVLNNAVQDDSLLHEHLGYDVYRRAGIPAHRTSFGVVTLNGFTYGIYVINEAVDRQFLGRNFGRDHRFGNLYEAACCADFATNPDAVELKHEVDENRSRDDLRALAALVVDTPDAELEAALDGAIDLDGFLTGLAIDAAFIHWDSYAYNTNNYYMFHNPADDRFVFLPHGMDQLLRGADFNPFPSLPGSTEPVGVLARRVLAHPALYARWQAAMDRVMADAFDLDAMNARIDQAAATLRSAPDADERTLADLERFEAELERTRALLAERRLRITTRDTAVCGDGAIEGFERCEDGDAVSEDGCSADCQPEYCGDGVVQAGLGEACEGPDCLPDCSAAAVCQAVAGGGGLLVCPHVRTAWEAADECAARGGVLAAPRTAGEDGQIRAVAFGVFAQMYWLGVFDEASEGAWVDSDGSPVDYVGWAPGRPDGDDGQNCVRIDPELAGWDDYPCWGAGGFVCRLD